jgi:predicted RND superfamily exporter protein
VPALIGVAIVLLVALLFAIDRATKAGKRIGRRREAKDRQRKATAEASKALTSLIPAIQEHDTPRHVH